MKPIPARRRPVSLLLAVMLTALCDPGSTQAVTTVFFDLSQSTHLIASGTTSDTVFSDGYLFTVTRDKLFTGGVGMTNPIGRSIRIPWPDGLEAQAVTTGPVLRGARIDIRREDGQTFAIEAFTARLLANTAGAGGAFEIMPLLNGEDGLPDPVMYDASGYYGRDFAYVTPELSGFDAYKMTLYVDFALMSLTVTDASAPAPTLEIVPVDGTTVRLSWPSDAVGYTLEFATTLPAGTWDAVTDSATVNADRFVIDLPITGSQRWFRLRK